MGSSLLIFSYGQSNADVHDAGPSFDAPCLQDPRIVVPNDGFGSRGLSGRPRRQDITGFDPAHSFAPNIQSINHAVAARYLIENPDTPYSQVIIRSGAKGGRPLFGFKKDDRDIYGIFLDSAGDHSPLLLDMFEDIRQIVAAAEAEGTPISQIAIPFFHGEADRVATRENYASALASLMDVIEAQLADLGIPVVWLMTQPSGTSRGFAGNAWENRLSVLDICLRRPNVHFGCANYAYELVDVSHLSATSKALIGEILGLQLSHVLHGQALPMTTLIDASVDGHYIDLTFEGPHGINLVADQCPAPHTPDGFEIKARKGQVITQVEQTGTHHIRLHCAFPVEQSRTELRYAFIINKRNTLVDQTLFPLGRGSLCDDWVADSAIVPGKQLRRWVPGFAVPLSEFAQKELAA